MSQPEVNLPIAELKLSDRDRDWIATDFARYYDLETGRIDPESDQDIHFMQVARGEVNPRNETERWWRRVQVIFEQQRHLADAAAARFAWLSEADITRIKLLCARARERPPQLLNEADVRYLGTIAPEVTFAQRPIFFTGGAPSSGKRR